MSGRPAIPHYPHPAPIEGYGKGGFRFAGMSHRGSLLCLPSGIYGWDAAGPHALDETTVGRVLNEAEAIDVFLVGCGRDLVPLAAPLREQLRARHIVAEPMSTGAAVRTFNVLLAEGRAVAAVLVAVD